MTIKEKVFEILSGDSGVTALCPPSRIKTDIPLQNIQRPYIRHTYVSVESIQTHDITSDMRRWPYQISIFADNDKSLEDLREAVTSALEESVWPSCTLTDARPLEGNESTDTPVIGVALGFDIWWAN